MMFDIKLEDVKSVYNGKDGHCCCGCAGEHTYASQHVEAASKSRGYPVEANEVNDARVKRIFNKVKANANNAEFISPTCVSVTVGTRLYVLYLN